MLFFGQLWAAQGIGGVFCTGCYGRHRCKWIKLYLHFVYKVNDTEVILHTTWKLKFLSSVFSSTSVNLELRLSPTSFWVSSTCKSSLSFFIPENPNSVAMCLSSCILVRIILSCLRYKKFYKFSDEYTSLPTLYKI